MINWISVDERKPPYGELVLVKFYNVFGELKPSVAKLSVVSVHAGKGSPKMEVWYMFPGWGKELKNVYYWHSIESIPIEVKLNTELL